MKKVLLYAFCLMLCGCVPHFVSHTQKIDLTGFYAQNPGAKVYYDGEEQTDKVELFRSWFDKELVIKKEGFEDYHVNLESEWTNELPFDAYGTIACAATHYFSGVGWALPVCIIGVPIDILTGTVSLPAMLIVNPWKQYEGENISQWPAQDKLYPINGYTLRTTIVLEPTDELKESCNKEGYFISNFGCTTCSYDNFVISSKDECSKCPGRYMDQNGYCRLCEGTVSKDGKSCIN